LAAIDSQEAVLVVNLGTRVLTTSIVSGNDVLLYRTIELPSDLEMQKIEVQRAIAVSAAFYEDRLQIAPHRLLYSGILPAREFAELVDDPAMAIGEVVPRPETGFASSLGNQPVAGVTGALAGTN